MTAEVRWRPQGEVAQYLVTWELRSGGLRGHLVSEETHASLSLWPEEEYVIQIFNGEEASAPLSISTRAGATSPPTTSPAWPLWRRDVLLVCSLCLACVAAAAALLCWLVRRQGSSKEQQGERERVAWQSLAW